MNSPSQCAQIRPELGVYVLGAISPADRARVSRHLASCPRCRDEVAGLAGLPALLGKVPLADALQLSEGRPCDPPGPPEPVLHQADGSSRQGATIAPDASPVAVRPSWLGRTAGTSTQLSGLQMR